MPFKFTVVHADNNIIIVITKPSKLTKILDYYWDAKFHQWVFTIQMP